MFALHYVHVWRGEKISLVSDKERKKERKFLIKTERKKD
jgi:hypothetical protein